MILDYSLIISGKGIFLLKDGRLVNGTDGNLLKERWLEFKGFIRH